MEVFNPSIEVESVPANQPDEYVKCPYFPEHELRKSRLPYHLTKCQKNPLAPKLLACPYNYMHRVHPSQKTEHLMFCEDKMKLKYSEKEEIKSSYRSTNKMLRKFNMTKTGFDLHSQKTDPPNNQSALEDGAEEEEMW